MSRTVILNPLGAPIKDAGGQVVGALEYVVPIDVVQETELVQTAQRRAAKVASYQETEVEKLSDTLSRLAAGDLTVDYAVAQADEDTAGALDGIVRIRAVQDLSPAAAVGFVLLLKRAVREVLAEGRPGLPEAPDLSELDQAVDRLLLEAFDLFAECRETIYRLRVGELKRGAPAACTGALDPINEPEDGCGGCGA